LVGSRASCSIGSGKDKAELRFKQGELIGAVVGERSGEEAVYEVLGWSEGHFSFAPGDPGPGEPLGSGFSQLLLEGCRLLDERNRVDTREPADFGRSTWRSGVTPGLDPRFVGTRVLG
jgi:hypothetical protein